MPKTRLSSPYPKFAKLISKYENQGELARNTSIRWRNGDLSKSLKWLAERPETLLALYEDIIEQDNGEEQYV